MKCPNCGQELENYEIYSEQYDSKYYETYTCVCPDCGETWEWVDVYEFSHTEGPWQVDPNDHL
jgi:endogenous inhibitor of DNA gyrase (YacG/DUF329 family)